MIMSVTHFLNQLLSILSLTIYFLREDYIAEFEIKVRLRIFDEQFCLINQVLSIYIFINV